MSAANTAAVGSSAGGKKKRRAQYVAGPSAAKRSRFAAVDITKGLRGFLVTCDQGKEQQCQREVLAWFTDYADRLYPPQPDADADAVTDGGERNTENATEDGEKERPSVGSALQAELEQLREPRTAHSGGSPAERFAAVDSGVRGIVFIQSRSPAVDHVSLLYALLEDVHRTRRLRTRYTIRIHPLLKTCFSRLEELSDVLAGLLPLHLPPLPPSERRSFAVVVNKRGQHELLHRGAVIECVVAKVGSGWFVDLEAPDVVVLVEVATRMAGVGIVERWQHFHRFNVRAMAEEGYKEQSTGASTEPLQTVESQKTVQPEGDPAPAPSAAIGNGR